MRFRAYSQSNDRQFIKSTCLLEGHALVRNSFISNKRLLFTIFPHLKTPAFSKNKQRRKMKERKRQYYQHARRAIARLGTFTQTHNNNLYLFLLCNLCFIAVFFHESKLHVYVVCLKLNGTRKQIPECFRHSAEPNYRQNGSITMPFAVHQLIFDKKEKKKKMNGLWSFERWLLK